MVTFLKATSELAIDSSYAATIDGKGNILVFDKNLFKYRCYFT
jgi:hypothetical protein